MKVKLLKDIQVCLVLSSTFLNYTQMLYPTVICAGTIGEVIAEHKNPKRYDVTFGHGFYLATNLESNVIEILE